MLIPIARCSAASLASPATRIRVIPALCRTVACLRFFFTSVSLLRTGSRGTRLCSEWHGIRSRLESIVTAFPEPFLPMLATEGAPPFGRAGWVYEEKADGYRVIAYKQGRGVALISRRMRNLLPRFPAVAAAIAELAAPSLILDGEIARFDEDLVSHLGYLKNRQA